MNIGEAVEALRRGRDVRLGKIYLVPCFEGNRVLPHALVKEGDILKDWSPTQEQIYSELWEVVPLPTVREPKKEEGT